MAGKIKQKVETTYTIVEAAKLTDTSFFLVSDLIRKGLLTAAGGGKKQGCKIELAAGAVAALVVIRDLRAAGAVRGAIKPISLHVCGLADGKLRAAMRGGKTMLICWPATFQPPQFVTAKAAEKAKVSGGGGIATDLAAIMGKLLGPRVEDGEPAGND